MTRAAVHPEVYGGGRHGERLDDPPFRTIRVSRDAATTRNFRCDVDALHRSEDRVDLPAVGKICGADFHTGAPVGGPSVENDLCTLRKCQRLCRVSTGEYELLTEMDLEIPSRLLASCILQQTLQHIFCISAKLHFNHILRIGGLQEYIVI